jgi:hypothetical protein
LARVTLAHKGNLRGATVSNFWENGGFFVGADALDGVLSGNATVQDYARGRTASATGVVPSGTRVAFTGKLSALLAYPEPPEKGETGTIVMVRTAMGDATEQDGMLFVKFDGGRLMAIHRAHLQRMSSTDRTANAYRVRVADLGDLTDFMKSAGGGDELIHKSSKDLWKLSKSGGEFIIERLFDETGSPLKV